MRRFAILIAVATTTSVAAADPPIRTRDDVYHRGDAYPSRDDRRDVRRDRDDRRDERWVSLVQSNPTSGSERQFVNVLGRGGALRRLVLRGERGAPMITRMGIEYSDRSVQTVELNVRLRRGDEERISLRGNQPINRIIVYTDPRDRGAYSIYGM